jgi:6-phosphogluconate dehydrogenase
MENNMQQNIGVIGLGVMGQNLALNIERNGFSVAGFDLDQTKLRQIAQQFRDKNIFLANSFESFIKLLETPKKILMMVPAGEPVDDVIKNLRPFLTKDDILIDGGNSFFKDTERRILDLQSLGIHYIGTGVSGGEEGALWGPSIMPGGSEPAWEKIKPIFQAISAKAEDKTPCCEWIGAGGAGHFVKMVHNGIEYGDMQMICEAYFLMKQALGATPLDMYNIFADWNQTELESYLIEITSNIMKQKDRETNEFMIDLILDTAGQKGTGKWTSQIALDLGVPVPTIAEAVFSRTLSAIKEQRVAASETLKGPEIQFEDDKEEMVELIRKALYASKICSYAQGFQLMKAASEEYKWNLNFGAVASIWREGCIIRAQFLNKIKDAFNNDPNLENLLLDSYFNLAIQKNQEAWRKVIAFAVEQGIPVPAFSSALAYYDSYRSGRLPANLLQAQRDYFGAHTYERIDKPRGEFFHTEWQS